MRDTLVAGGIKVAPSAAGGRGRSHADAHRLWSLSRPVRGIVRHLSALEGMDAEVRPVDTPTTGSGFP
jgi:hypothetical protein